MDDAHGARATDGSGDLAVDEGRNDAGRGRGPGKDRREHPAGDLPTLVGRDFTQASRAVLQYVQDRIPLDFWAVSRVVDGKQVYLQVSSDEVGPAPGDSTRWEATLCQAMWETDAPRVVPDVDEVAVYSRRREQHQMPVRAHVGIPLLRADGELFGTVCGVNRATTADLEGHTALLELLGDLLSHVLSAEQQNQALARELDATRRQADTDPMTGILNRRAWQRLCAAEETRHRMLGDHLSVIVVDLDDLKSVNDLQGHLAGDELILLTATVLEQTSRAADATARLGGDEFAILCPRTTGQQVQRVSTRIRTAFDAVGIRASLGAATMDHDGNLVDTLARADRAMYAAKQERRDAQ